MKYVFPEAPFTIWLTGLSGSGKTTIASELYQLFLSSEKQVHIIDGDVLREGLCSDLNYSLEHRGENIRRAAEVASILNKAGVIAIVALISPLAKDRQNARNIIGPENFAEIHVATSIDVCELRDTKGLYKKARRDEISNFTGVSSPYECPLNPLVAVDTSLFSPKEVLNIIMAALEEHFAKTL